MTDNDDPSPPRHAPSSNGLGSDGSREGAAQRSRHGLIRWAQGSGTGPQVAPTDPEVPSAKRRGAVRRQRSLVGLTALVLGLLSITLAGLYRASQRVGAGDPNGSGMTSVRGTRSDTLFPPDAIPQSTRTGLAPAPGVRAGNELSDDAPADEQASTDSAPGSSASPQPKGPPPAIDIIRTPAF
ncbi:MAG TPA: hypothetical protein VK540_34140 [Polyangiaceae bacterium]|nr:hypothetical protein [Polyangiaceae bacterium]